jgi:hypothetical protein
MKENKEIQEKALVLLSDEILAKRLIIFIGGSKFLQYLSFCWNKFC